MRIVLIGFIIVLLVLSCGLVIRYNQDATHSQEELNNERYLRMVAEENFQKANQLNVTLSTQLTRAKTRIEDTESILEKTEMVNMDLRNRLDKVELTNKTMNKKVQELLRTVGGSSEAGAAPLIGY